MPWRLQRQRRRAPEAGRTRAADDQGRRPRRLRDRLRGERELRGVLEPVYAALGIDWDPATTGCVADAVPGTTAADVEAALLAALEQRFELREVEPDQATLDLARELEPRHRVAVE